MTGGSAGHAAIYVKLALTAAFWGGTFIAGRITAGDVGPFSGAFLRFLFASILLILLTLRAEKRSIRVPLDEVPRLAMLGLSGTVLYNVFFFKGLQTVSAGRASVIVALNPAFIAGFSWLLFGERFTGQRALGILLSLAGAVTVVSRGHFEALIQGGVASGDLFILGCVGSWVAYTLIGKRAMDRLSPLVVVTWSAAIGTLGLVGPAIREGLPQRLAVFPSAVWLGVAYLAVFGTVFGFVWFYEGVKVLGPTKAGVFINFVPASAVAMGVLLLHESPTMSLCVGLLLVTVGVFLTNCPTRSPSRSHR